MLDIKSIYSNRCWIEGKLRPATLQIENGLIVSIHDNLLPGALHMGDDVLMPGVIDAHVHVNEPGRTSWEGFETATMAAAAGGITTIVDMPLNASPTTISLNALNEKIKSTQQKLHVNVAFYGGLVPGNLNEIEPLILAGVCGIKCFLVHSGIDEFPSVEKPDIEAAMQQMAKYQISLLAHCELEKEIPGLNFSANPGSYSSYLSTRPKSWENEAVAMMIALSKKHDCPIHIVHVSSSEALALIEVAKKEGVKINAETCAHYLYFNAEDIPDNNTLFKCAPPIRERENNLMLKNALASGVLDFITTDHSPAPPEIKEIETGNLLKAWGGIAGLQFLLPASWTAMKDILSIEDFIPILTSRPAQFLKCNKKGKIEVGQEADLVIWSPESSFLVEEKDILHRHKLSPYTGEKLYGVVKQTIVGGESVFQLNKSASNLHKGKIFLAENKKQL